ncbi:MAG: hypothetical protein ACLVJ6_06460 [Merdibacter sp.]
MKEAPRDTILVSIMLVNRDRLHQSIRRSRRMCMRIPVPWCTATWCRDGEDDAPLAAVDIATFFPIRSSLKGSGILNIKHLRLLARISAGQQEGDCAVAPAMLTRRL